MQVSSNTNQTDIYAQYTQMKLQGKEDLKNNYSEIKIKFEQSSMTFSTLSSDIQAKITQAPTDQIQRNQQDFQKFLKDIGYDGKPIGQLSQGEAKALVADDGFFGIDKTAQRIADFVINGSGGDESLLRAGRSGIMQGFEEAQKLWGGKLPDISQKTIEKATDLINQKMSDLGYAILDTNA